MSAAATLAVGLALAAAPQRVTLAPAAHAAITVRNFGERPATVSVAVARYRLDLRGRPVIGGRAEGWVRVAPQRLRIPPHAAASVGAVARVPARAAAGDHSVVVVFTGTTATQGARVVARLGVVVAVRVPGRVVRRLALATIAVRQVGRRRVLAIRVRNRGNVDAWLDDRAVVVRARRRGRIAAAWSGRGRRVLAGGVTLYTWIVPPRLRGRLVELDVSLRAGSSTVRRRYHRRL